MMQVMKPSSTLAPDQPVHEAYSDLSKLSELGHLHEGHPVLQSCLAVLKALILVASVVGNVVVFVVFYKKRYLLTPSNRLILNLALTNFIMAVLVMPSVLVSVIADRWLFGDPWCQIIGLMTSVLFSACIFTLVLISLDRYCAVVTPLRYMSRVTVTRIHVALGLVWTLSVVISLPPLFGWSRFVYQAEKHSCTVNWKTTDSAEKIYTLFLTILCFCAPFVLMLWIYITIIHAAQQSHKRARRRTSINLPDASDSKALNGKPSTNGRSIGPRRSSIASAASSLGQVFRKDEWKAAKTTLVIVSAFTVCWMPYFIVITLETLLEDPTVIPVSVESFVVLLYFFDCAVNPVVYVFRNTAIRYEIGKIMAWRQPIHELDLERRSSVSQSTTTGDVTPNHRFTRRSMSLPSPPSNLNLNGILRTSEPIVHESHETEPGDPNVLQYLERCAKTRHLSIQESRVTFKSPAMLPKAQTSTNNLADSGLGDNMLLPGEIGSDC